MSDRLDDATERIIEHLQNIIAVNPVDGQVQAIAGIRAGFVIMALMAENDNLFPEFVKWAASEGLREGREVKKEYLKNKREQA